MLAIPSKICTNENSVRILSERSNKIIMLGLSQDEYSNNVLFLIEACEPDKYGHQCEGSCSGCLNGTCSPGSACEDGCKLGRFGKYCKKKCSPSCTACDQATGTCLLCNIRTMTQDAQLNCIVASDWITNDPKINQSCEAGKYGLNCNLDCPMNCYRKINNVSVCDRYTGACLYQGCQEDIYGAMCSFKCPTTCAHNASTTSNCGRLTGNCDNGCHGSYYGYKCQHICGNCEDGKCVQENGACKHGCLVGWKGGQCEGKPNILGEKTRTCFISYVVPPDSKHVDANNRPAFINLNYQYIQRNKPGNKYYTQDNTNTRENPI